MVHRRTVLSVTIGWLASCGVTGGSPDMPRSAGRVDRFTQQLKDEMNVEIVDSIGELLEKVDAVLLTSVDGRPHLQQITPVLEARKPVFVGKPVAGCLANVIRIYRLAERHRVPIFAASSRRFNARILETADPNRVGEVVGCDTFSQVYPNSGKGGYGVTVFGTEDIAASGLLPQWICYEPLTVALAEFFKTGRPPVSAEETLELYAFLEAAEESVRQGGRPIDVMETLRRADKAAQQDDLDEP